MEERILVIKHGALGDFIFSIGSMYAIRDKHPHAHISLMTMGMFANMAKQLGCFDDIIVDNRVRYWNLAANYRAIRSITRGGFSIIYDLQVSSRTRKRYAPMVRFFSKHSYTWYDSRLPGYKITKNGWGFGKKEPALEPVPSRVSDLRNLHGKGEHFDELPERYVMLIPGCSPTHPYKRWSVENYCKLAQKLAEHGIHSVIIGTKTEEKEILEIAASTPMAVNFLGKNSLLDIPDMAARALACVGNDTGPTHMSVFCGTPVISIFSNITRNSARFLKDVPTAIPLISPEDDINRITLDMVWEKLQPHLGK